MVDEHVIEKIGTFKEFAKVYGWKNDFIKIHFSLITSKNCLQSYNERYILNYLIIHYLKEILWQEIFCFT